MRLLGGLTLRLTPSSLRLSPPRTSDATRYLCVLPIGIRAAAGSMLQAARQLDCKHAAAAALRYRNRASNHAGARKKLYKAPSNSIPVGIAFEGALHLHTDVVSLLLAQLRELSTQGRQVQPGHLLVQLLRQEVDLVLVALALLPVLQDVQLPQDLVREGAGHHERRMTRGAAQVQQAPRRQDDDAMAIREDEAINLRLDVLHLDTWEVLQLVHLDLVVKVTDVPHDCVVLHLLHVLQGDPC